VHDESLHDALRLLDAPAVAGQENGIVALHEFVEGAHVGDHAALWRRDHRGVPAHHVIAR
jgi:hypothetical protein